MRLQWNSSGIRWREGLRGATVKGKYASEEAAFRRVDKLKTFGIWTGIRNCGDDSYELLYDPDVEAETFRHDMAAPAQAD
jgi:hypothetical protein